MLEEVCRNNIFFNDVFHNFSKQQEESDTNASIHGNWTIENAKGRLHQYLQKNNLPQEYKYTASGPDNLRFVKIFLFAKKKKVINPIASINYKIFINKGQSILLYVILIDIKYLISKID